MYARFFAATAVLALSFGSAFPGAPKSDDAKNIQGTWKIVSLIKDLESTPDEELRKIRVSITKDQFIITSSDKTEPLKYRLNAAKNPKELDLIETLKISSKDDKDKVKDSKSVDSVMHGIYELTGDDLKICVSGRGKPASRPTNFKSEQRNTVIVLKREK